MTENHLPSLKTPKERSLSTFVRGLSIVAPSSKLRSSGKQSVRRLVARASSIAALTAFTSLAQTPRALAQTTPTTGSVYTFIASGNPVQSVGYDDPATPEIEGSITDVGLLRYLKVEYNTFWKELFFDVVYEPSPLNLIPDSISLLITTGQEPGSQGQYANIILDGSTPGSPILTAYAYNNLPDEIRDNLQNSWVYGNSTATATADRISSTHPLSGQTDLVGNPLPADPPEGPTMLHPRGLSVAALAPGTVVEGETLPVGGVRLTFVIESEPLLGHTPKYPGSYSWQGISEGPKFGIWLLSMDLQSISYGTTVQPFGFISKWVLDAFACHSLYQFKDVTPSQVPVDCKGVYNGTTPLAACFPEEPVEITCEENRFQNDLFALDSGANALFENFKWGSGRINRLARNKKYRRALRSIRKFAATNLLVAESEYHKAWEASWALPQTVISCSNGLKAGCAEKPLSPLADQYSQASSNLQSLNQELARRLRRIRRVPGTRDLAKALGNNANKEYGIASELAMTIPASTVECAAES